MPVMLHGEAVAAGMICEAYLSTEIAGLAGDELSEISSVIQSYFDPKPIHDQDFDDLLSLIRHDKKRSGSGMNFSLLESIGKPRMNCLADNESILRSIRYFNQICKQG
ncbi:MAG: 3-dehydroquinate synthase [Bacteroidales bacterium]|nr:3-dehydroquinate synthase [Bacteroidales bacterium]